MSDMKAAREAAAKAYQVERGKWRVSGIPDNLAVPLVDAAIDAFLSELEKTHAVVPLEPTTAMICAGISERHDQPVPEAWSMATVNIYRAMLKAAEPQPTSQR